MQQECVRPIIPQAVGSNPSHATAICRRELEGVKVAFALNVGKTNNNDETKKIFKKITLRCRIYGLLLCLFHAQNFMLFFCLFFSLARNLILPYGTFLLFPTLF